MEVYTLQEGEPYIAEHINIEFVGHYISSVLIVPIQKNGNTLATLELIISDPDKTFRKDAQDAATQSASRLADKL